MQASATSKTLRTLGTRSRTHVLYREQLTKSEKKEITIESALYTREEEEMLLYMYMTLLTDEAIECYTRDFGFMKNVMVYLFVRRLPYTHC